MRTPQKQKKTEERYLYRVSLLMILFFLCATMAAFSQTKAVKGKVVDDMNEPLVGIAVSVKNTTTGVLTDIDGNYTINVPNENSVLVYTYLGFKPKEVRVGTQSVIDIVMEADLQTLEEVVIVGYTAIRRQSLTGALQTVNSDKLLDTTTPSAENLLVGKAPGVFVTTPSGRPGDKANIVIRGKSTVSGSTDPLWVIDGVIVGNSPYDINPNDIESMTVLKDAASTAIYGSQGANGVIVVTTKKARSGKPKINVSAKFVATHLNNGSMEMMSGADLYNYYDSFPNKEIFDSKSWWTPDLKDRNYDWWDNATETGFAQDYNISINGGTDKLRTFVSLGYYDEKGAVKGYDFTRYNGMMKVEYDIAKWLTIKPQIVFSKKDVEDKEHDVSAMYSKLPWDSPYDADGNLVSFNPIPSWVNTTGTNYLWDLQWNYSKSKTYEISGNFDFDVRITDWLTYASVNNYKYSNYAILTYQDPRSSSGLSVNGRIEDDNRSYDRIYTNQLLRINKILDKHMINAVLGYEWNEYNYKRTQSKVTSIPPGFESGKVGSKPELVYGEKAGWAVQSFLSNVNYTYDNRYLAQVSLRRDGASNFGPNDRWGTFFSVSGGWNIHNESFFKYDKIDNLKLRASYGSVGNRPVKFYPYQGLFSVDKKYGYNELPGAVVSQLPNDDLKWEKSMALGIGVDVSFLNRFNLTFDYYKKNTTDLLFRVPIPSVVGVDGIWRNVGEVENKGFELSIGADIINNKELLWNVSANIGINRNELTKLYGGMTQVIANDDSGISGSASKLLTPGKDVDTWYLPEWAGVNPDTGKAQWYKTDANGSRVLTEKYSEADFVPMGAYTPDFYGGFSTNLSYKGIDLSAVFGYSVGGTIYNYSRTEYDSDGAYTDRNQMKLHSGWSRWEKPGDIATHPQASYNNALNKNSNSASSRFLETGTYLKLRNITLGYSIPGKLWNLAGVRFYISGENLFTISHYSGVDPEVPPRTVEKGKLEEKLSLSGTAVNTYPQTRKFVFGVNITL